MKVIVNKVRCKKCNSIIESKYTHDFQRCECGAIAIDGGREYQRLLWPSGKEMEDYIDFSYSIYGESGK
ncbi:DUF7695 domain-containing protein [Ornithinibacillus bavariensis]|uniref:DUF7695 domain-containing protein n=1 Tax=Ornithinibacillus bavariensis TaxID=545502 RepID=A0A919XAW8_9BACI|nr:hypothetical protein [Ornithinibacillus bavariensis]GIO28058.1 hypothetical protein J43TS3_26690 [Ornithinibacillus bavariensis]